MFVANIFLLILNVVLVVANYKNPIALLNAYAAGFITLGLIREFYE